LSFLPTGKVADNQIKKIVLRADMKKISQADILAYTNLAEDVLQ